MEELKESLDCYEFVESCLNLVKTLKAEDRFQLF